MLGEPFADRLIEELAYSDRSFSLDCAAGRAYLKRG